MVQRILCGYSRKSRKANWGVYRKSGKGRTISRAVKDTGAIQPIYGRQEIVWQLTDCFRRLTYREEQRAMPETEIPPAMRVDIY